MNDVVILNDNVGRVIIGETVTEDSTNIILRNPAIINVVPNQAAKQLQVQFIPYIFTEFLAPGEKNTEWQFNKSTCVLCKAGKLDDKLIQQYNRVFNPSPIIQSAHPTPPIVKLFE